MNSNYVPLIKLLKSIESIAFLIIKKDTLLFETNYDSYNNSSLSYSFSMAKSFTSMLIVYAIDVFRSAEQGKHCPFRKCFSYRQG